MDWYLIGFGTAAVVLTGLAKGGFSGAGTISTPLLALAVPPIQAASILLPILILQDIYGVWLYRRQVDWRVIATMAPGAGLGIIAGYLLMTQVPEQTIAVLIGAIAMAFAIRSLLRAWRGIEVISAPRPLAGFSWGGLSGFTSMTTHAGSPPFQIYALSLDLPKEVFAGTSVIFFAIVNGLKLAPYIMLGQMTTTNLTISLWFAPLALLATALGLKLVRHVDTRKFFLVINLLLLLVGIVLLAQGLRGYLA